MLKVEHWVQCKKMNNEVRVSFVNVQCFFDFKGECGVCSVDVFKARGWIDGFTWVRFKKVSVDMRVFSIVVCFLILVDKCPNVSPIYGGNILLKIEFIYHHVFNESGIGSLNEKRFLILNDVKLVECKYLYRSIS